MDKDNPYLTFRKYNSIVEIEEIIDVLKNPKRKRR